MHSLAGFHPELGLSNVVFLASNNAVVSEDKAEAYYGKIDTRKHLPDLLQAATAADIASISKCHGTDSVDHS